METAKYQFIKSSKPLAPKTIECVIANLGSLNSPSKKLAVGRRWSAAALKQLSEKTSALKKDVKQDTKSLELQISFENGSQWRAIFVSSSIKTFDLHCAMKKAFENAVKSNDSLRVNFINLNDNVETQSLQAFASLLLTSRWKPDQYGMVSKAQTGGKEKKVPNIEIATDIDPIDAKKIVEEGFALARANNLIRTLGQTPSNHLTPESYRKEIERRAKEKKYKTEFFDRKKLEVMGAGAFLAVTQASLEDKGGILHLTQAKKPTGALKKIILVGKGLCFDTGGYNIKTGNFMYGMHKDMLGSAIALSLFETLNELELDIEIHAYLALAENLISHRAYRPNDVVIALDGTAIEVIDTDAEGRMVLCDTLTLARRQKPDLVIDFATLTGCAMRAIDTRRGALFSNRTDLIELGFQAGETSGERNWPFPIGEDYREQLKSDIADIMQCTTGNNADHIYAATFLSHFVGDETPWLHLDLTPASNKGGLGLVSTENTGYGVRWGLEVIKRFLNNDS